jgi:O-antigen biosynthesis protein
MTEPTPDAGPVLPEPSVRRGARVPDNPSLSVCILILERAQLALGCLHALRRPGGSPPGTEFVVVANGTSADELENLAGDDLVLVVNRENLGFAGGCNQAASVARAPLIVFLNDDSAVEKGCIEALVRAASEDPAIGAVGSRIVSVDGTLEEAGSVLWRDGSAAHVGKRLPPGSDAYREPRDVDYVSANGLLVTRRAWDVVGGFDERYFPAYFEDVDLCLALSERGFRIRYEPQALVAHRGSQSTSVVFRGFLLRRNQRKLVEKWGRALERFEPPPAKDSGPAFDAAMERAITRTQARVHSSTTVAAGAAAGDLQRPALSAHPSQAAADLRVEYQAYLEQRVADGDRRVTTLETYLSGLWGVRLRRRVGGWLNRRQS